MFHFDSEVAEEALENIEPQELIVISGRGTAVQDLYFDLSDDVVLLKLFKVTDDDNERYMEELSEVMAATSDLYLRFIRAAHSFLAAAMTEFGVRQRPPRPSDPAERACKRAP